LGFKEFAPGGKRAHSRWNLSGSLGKDLQREYGMNKGKMGIKERKIMSLKKEIKG